MTRSTVAGAVFALTGTLLWVGTAHAGDLAPQKASDLRTITQSGASCPGIMGSSQVLDTQRNPDGTSTAFSIPPGSVFVVTSYSFSGGGAGFAQGTEDSVYLGINTAGNPLLIAHCGATSGANTGFAGSCAIPDGVAVKSGSVLCTWPLSEVEVLVHGFIAKDK